MPINFSLTTPSGVITETTFSNNAAGGSHSGTTGGTGTTATTSRANL